MINEVIISITEGEPYFPPQVPPRLCYGKDYPYSRMGEVVNIMKQEGLKNKYSVRKITKEFLDEIPYGQIFTLTGDNSNEFLYVRKPGEKKSRAYRICKVNDSTLPWTINKLEDGREKIEYLDSTSNCEIIDKELQYAKRK